jgi:aminopeptidase N
VLDKWFALQAAAQRPDTVDRVEQLAKHPDFVMTNPNRLRALVGTFGRNHWAFHHPSGRGYTFVADMILAADALNPQVAARMARAFDRWRKFDQERQAKAKAALERIRDTKSLSRDVGEIVTKALA